jgi:hypothetical protein
MNMFNGLPLALVGNDLLGSYDGGTH